MSKTIKSLAPINSIDTAISSLKARYKNTQLRTKTITKMVICEGVVTDREWVLNPNS
jgi:hypothetical protein